MEGSALEEDRNCDRKLRQCQKHRRTGQHPLGGGGRPCFARMNSVGEGGGVVAEIFRDPYSGGGGVVAEIFRWRGSPTSGRIFSINSSNKPSIRVIQTCIGFCPNNVASLPECMSTNCPNWGGGQLSPLPPVPYAYGQKGPESLEHQGGMVH